MKRTGLSGPNSRQLLRAYADVAGDLFRRRTWCILPREIPGENRLSFRRAQSLADDISPFKGAKIALLYQGQLIAYQRDQKPDIPFPGMWDLPGGGREEGETPMECAIRETQEEFDITIDPEWIVWERHYPAPISTDPGSYFFVAKLEGGFGPIRFGDEGQQWAIMPIAEFLDHSEVVESLKSRLRDYLLKNA